MSEVEAQASSENQDAAKLLIAVKTKLGKVVPEYAKEIVAGTRAVNDRAATELSTLLCQINAKTRSLLLHGNPELKTWFEAYVKVHQKDKLHVGFYLSTAYL